MVSPMKTPIFTGACVAIVTPYNENGIDFDKLGELIELQIAGGTNAITICGTTGEASTQSIRLPSNTASRRWITGSRSSPVPAATAP